jgi:FKBP-type peptidyl-prolyl cis-trans isomerase 2
VRTISALVVTVGLLASLTACATASAPGEDGCPPTGDAAAVVTATGAFGEKPDARVPSPIVTTETQVSTLIEGDGDEVVDGTPVLIDYTLYDGTTGAEVEDSGYDGSLSAPITVGGNALAPLASALECSRVGSRVAVAIKASELSASVSGGAAETDDAPDAAYVAVVDIRQSFLPKANGRHVLGEQGMPAVVTAPDGAPGITVPASAAPTETESHLVLDGSGRELTTDDTAVVQFTAVTWDSPSTVATSTWTDGGAATSLPLGDEQVPGSIRDALVGATIGSQVMVVVPADEASGVPSTLVYVFDVLGAL